MSMEDFAIKIKHETGKGHDMSQRMAQELSFVHESLKPVVSAWLRDERLLFELEGITLDSIIIKENCTYIQAVLTMDILLKNPDFIPDYKAMTFDSDYLGGL